MSDKRTNDEIRADVIVSHFLGTEIVPTIPDALRLSEQIARALSAVRREELRTVAKEIRARFGWAGGYGKQLLARVDDLAADHEHRWIDVTRIGDAGYLRFICTVTGCAAVDRVAR